MLKIPTAKEMADLTEVSRKNYEESVMNSATFNKVVSDIEQAALEGKGSIMVPLESEEALNEFEVIKKYLLSAGYVCSYFQRPLSLSKRPDALLISWRLVGDKK